MKVMVVVNGLGTGGTQRSMAEMLPFFLESEIAPIVVALSRVAEGIEEEVRSAGFDVRVLDEDGWVPRIRALRRLIDAEQPDLVHTMIFESDVVGRLAATRRPTPVLTSLVNTQYAAVRRNDPRVPTWKLRAVRSADRFTARRLSDHFHAVSHAVRDDAVAALRIDPRRVTVIERGRDPGRLGEPSPERTARARAALGLPEGSRVVVTVGRQEFAKGQATLLDAAARLGASHPDLVVLVAGRKGNATPELKAQHRGLGLGDRVRFLGHRDDVPEVLAAADVFAFPSRYEGSPGAVIEAMALGLPVVATDIPAVRETVEPDRNAVLVPPDAADALAGALSALLEDPSRAAAFGQASRQRFEDRFTLDRSASRMVELYRAVAGPIPGGAEP